MTACTRADPSKDLRHPTTRAAMLRSVNVLGSTLDCSISVHVHGAETGAPGLARTAYAAAKVALYSLRPVSTRIRPPRSTLWNSRVRFSDLGERAARRRGAQSSPLCRSPPCRRAAQRCETLSSPTSSPNSIARARPRHRAKEALPSVAGAGRRRQDRDRRRRCPASLSPAHARSRRAA